LIESVTTMRLKFTISILILLLPIAGLFISREGLPSRETSAAVRQDDLLEKLSIEPVGEMEAPDFVLKDLDGNSIRLRDLRGKVILLNFWATWCPSCRFEMPSMEALHKEFSGRELVVLAVNFQESAENVRSFYQEHNLSLPALLDPGAKVFALYQAWSLPTTLVINKQGHVVGKVVGYRDWDSDQSKALFTELLKGAA
jgi:peroxiredoxin